MEYGILNNQNQEVYIWDRGRTVSDAQGRITKCVGAYANLTERRQLEAQLRQAQKMEAMGTLAGGIAHDFNNILTGIMGNAELISLDMPENSPMEESLNEILLASNRASDLVAQILTFSHQGKINRQRVDLQPTLNEVEQFLRSSLPASMDIVDVHRGPLPPVVIDTTQIYQAVLNLCTNSWHAIGDRPGRIEISTEVRSFVHNASRPAEELKPGSYVILTIKDDGPGIDGAVRDRIFEPFFTTKPSGKGTGMGLPVVHGIMHNHEGAITIDSLPGEGTTVRLYFPVAPEHEAGPAVDEIEMHPTPAVENQAVPAGQGQSVYVLDDEEMVRKYVRSTLLHLGYTVTVQENPILGIAELESGSFPYDLVLTDLTMPGMTGVEFARRALVIKPDLKIILMTGHLQDDLTEYREIGFCDVLQKPLNVRSLGWALAAAFGIPADSHAVTMPPTKSG